MKAMIFAAGLGTRLKPITDALPKALVPVAGRPLIEHVCRKLKNAGIEEAVVNVHHFADKVETWAADQQIMTLQISDERDCLLETGGAVLHARTYLKDCGRFLIHNVDILSNLDLRWFGSAAPADAMATLLVSRRKTSRMLLFDQETMILMGWQNVSTGQVRSPFADIDPEKCLALAFSGIHIMSDRIFEQMQIYAQKSCLTIGGDSPKFSIIDFYLWACAEHKICGVLAENLELVDVGKLDTLNAAEDFVSKNL